MSKIAYHKNCIKNPPVEKAKRMLNKIDKQFGGFNGIFHCNIQLTGVNDIDRSEIKRLIENHFKDLKRKIDKQLLQNEKLVNGKWNDEYEEGFYTPTFVEELNLIIALNEVHSHIWSLYPDIEIKKTEPFIFSEISPEGKYFEAKNHFEKNPVYGFQQKYFAVLKNETVRELYPFTFSKFDLVDAKSIYATYL
jgi:hypothetical protein